LVSEGVIITAFPDDTLEAVTAVKRAYKGHLEPLLIHEGALDVLAHQIVGIVMDKREVTVDEALKIVNRAYPYRDLTRKKFLEVAQYLHRLREVWLEGDSMRRSRRTREYYHQNLSMIPDERRYPVVDVLSDRTMGTVGDEFMALRARLGLNIIIRGKVWRIVQIEEETGAVYVVPAEDPFAALPGWDGEMLPVPLTLAQETGQLRNAIAQELKTGRKPEETAEKLAQKLATDKSTLLQAVQEIQDQLKEGAPVPTENHILIEAFDKWIVVHACYGEVVNRTLGAIFDAILSDQELITGWWNDGYRILIEASRKIEQDTLAKLPNILFRLTPEDVDKAFADYLKARFPFSYKMKFIAERFGALPRGKTMGPERLAELPSRFAKTPIYEETIRETMLEKVDMVNVKEIMQSIKEGRIKVSTLLRLQKPTPLGYRILAKYVEVPELMAPERVLINNIERMKQSIQARRPSLLCLNCGHHSEEKRLRDLEDKLVCPKCGSGLLADLHPIQDPEMLIDILRRRLKGKQLSSEELDQLTHARRTADMVLSHGKKALIAFQVRGVGPETAFRILSKMHPNDDDFYMDLLKAKVQFLRTRQYWEDKKEKR
jgi:ATP-dependent Lhr-like helicase